MILFDGGINLSTQDAQRLELIADTVALERWRDKTSAAPNVYPAGWDDPDPATQAAAKKALVEEWIIDVVIRTYKAVHRQVHETGYAPDAMDL